MKGLEDFSHVIIIYHLDKAKYGFIFRDDSVLYGRFDKGMLVKENKIRIYAVFHGEVQGVGFRYTARQAANALGLTVWVRNEYDGSVSAEIQGDRDSIQEWLRMVNSGRYIDISHVDMQEIDAIETERNFRVEF